MNGKLFRIDATGRQSGTFETLRAVASEGRMDILRHLGDRVVPVNEIARDLRLPVSTAAMHVAILERAGLIHCEMRPASRGVQKVCARTYDELLIELPRAADHGPAAMDVSVPIGGYSDFDVEPPCGLASATGLIGYGDDINTFYEPDRMNAQLIWFRAGFLEYRLPNRMPPGARVESFQLTGEVCSEAPLHNVEWPSDITVWVNGVSLGAWTSPGDFGGQRGYLTPFWWDERDSQFGVLKRWRVTVAGTTIDGVSLSGVTLDDLELRPGRLIRIRIGVERGGTNVGGLNLFGRAFGNYPQDLALRLEYTAAPPASAAETR
jgi:predicted transcriptional regulator